ncbi:hypothetical protein BGZ94_006719 [Podila epigama]|nr:hypothetical protein BGZ94_006719 [Podila epigama]
MKPFKFRAASLKRLQNTLGSITITNIILIISNFTFLGSGGPFYQDNFVPEDTTWASSKAVLASQIALNVGIIAFLSFKGARNPSKRWMLASTLAVILLLFFVISVLRSLIAGNSQNYMMWIVQAVHLLMAALIIFEHFLASQIDFSLPEYNADAQFESTDQPIAVYLYRPRIDPDLVHTAQPETNLTTTDGTTTTATTESIESSASTASTATTTPTTTTTGTTLTTTTGTLEAATGGARLARRASGSGPLRRLLGQGNDDDNDFVDLDELPMYQRFKPPNAAVIIDMANLNNDVAAPDALPPSESPHLHLPLPTVPVASAASVVPPGGRGEGSSSRSSLTMNRAAATTLPTSVVPTSEPPSYSP